MKYILLSIAVIITMAACQNKEDVSSIPIVPVYNNSVLSDTARTDDAMEPKFAESRPKQAIAKRTVRAAVHRNRASETTYQPPAETTPVLTPAPASPGVNTIPSTTGVGNSPSTGTSTIPQPEKKKGWSKATKGAVIGGAAGAIGGAIISKKKGLGAVIGGVIGVAGGYAIGKGMDKKDNRFVTY
ncbi:MAG: glycine zipper domain-containing protein [Ginsengibacter sp.]